MLQEILLRQVRLVQNLKEIVIKEVKLGCWKISESQQINTFYSNSEASGS